MEYKSSGHKTNTRRINMFVPKCVRFQYLRTIGQKRGRNEDNIILEQKKGFTRTI